MVLKGDILKWRYAETAAEREDVMSVESVDGPFIRVRHIGEAAAPVSVTREDLVRKVGTMKEGESLMEAYRKHKKL